MTEKQIQPRRDYQITPRVRPRGLTGQVSLALLQPGYFFRTLPLMEATRSWLWAAVLVLALVALSAVRQEALSNADSGGGVSPPAMDFGGAPPGTDLGGGGGIAPIDPGFSGIPGGEIPGGMPTTPVADVDVTSTWTTALLTIAGMIVGWVVLTLLLSEVSLFNGRAPVLGHNFQISIWASLPLAFMAALQLIYYSAGGEVGQPGVSGLLADVSWYSGLPTLARSLILSLATHLTIFWLWNLALIYLGARHALEGKRWSSALVVVAWAVLVVVAPVVTGEISAEAAGDETTLPVDGGLPLDMMGISPETTPDAIEATAEADSTAEATGEAEADSTPEAALNETAEPDDTPDVSEAPAAQVAPVRPNPSVSEGAQPTPINRP